MEQVLKQVKSPYDEKRLTALRRFAMTQTIITLLGHAWFGFEVAYALPFIAAGTAYFVQTVLGVLRSRLLNQKPWFFNSFSEYVTFLLPAHIVAMTCAMFLYPGDRLVWPIMFAVTLAIASKFVFTIPVYENGKVKRVKHFLNPANLAIITCLVLFPDISVVLPYGFSAYSNDYIDVALPIIVFISGGLLTLKYNPRWPLVIAFLGTFVAQGVARALFFDANVLAALAPATGVIAILFTFYMAPDPGTSPSKPKEQVVFGASISVLYGVLMVFNVVFALFWALVATCALYGLYQVVTADRKPRAANEPQSDSNVVELRKAS